MTQPLNDQEPAGIADLHDRLMDCALAEVVGQEVPPDLSAQILADGTKLETNESRRQFITWRSGLLAVAATLLIAFTISLSQVGSYRSAALRTQVMDRSASVALPDNKTIGPEGLIKDASNAPEPTGTRRRGEENAGFGVATEQPPTPEYADFFAPVVPESAATPPAATDGTQYRPQILARRQTVQSEWGYGLSAQSGRMRRYYHLDSTVVRKHQQIEESRRRADRLVDQRTALSEEEELRRLSELGTGPDLFGDQYTRIYENPFIKAVGGDAVSTFSIDVDTASYANVRQFLMDMRQLPPPDAVRIEELVNYFDYDYAGPVPSAPGSAGGSDSAPFAAHVEVADCPWAPEHRLVRIGIKGREIEQDHRPPSNLVFLVDVSGSMDEPNKLPLVVDGLRQLTRELGENDRVAIVVYASSEGLALESTRGNKQQVILAALGRLQAGGSTAGGAGIQLAYQIAEDHFIPGGTNRVVLCTDGDFNVGVTSTAELERLVTRKAKDTKVFLSVLGFGRGNLNDAMMQTIADRGNGNHYYVDNLREARKVLVEEMTGTLITIAKDVKIQVEFNPAEVSGYRLLGYENRLLRTEDFNDDTKDAGEIGAGHTVTALYELIPAGKSVVVPAVDELKYQHSTKSPSDAPAADTSRELLTLKMRYKEPEGDVSRKLEWPITDARRAFSDATGDFQFAAAVAGFGLLLRESQYKGSATYDAMAEIAASSLGDDPRSYRAELVGLVTRARELQSGD